MKSTIRKVAGGVCAAKEFRAGAVHAGIKRVKSTKDDLAIIVSSQPCSAAGVFTTNRVQAAPVRLSKEYLKAKTHRAILLNSGNANACTGPEGDRAAEDCVRLAAEIFGIAPTSVLVCSTGRIGVPLPVEKFAAGIKLLPDAISRKGSRAAAVAIMTSDTFPKESAREVTTPRGTFRIGAIAKGAGMINPNMATMLCAVTTDVGLSPALARTILREVVEETFNRITVDGDMSTNDTVLLLANAASAVSLDKNSPELPILQQVLRDICMDLARQIVRDGEGTSKVVELLIEGAKSASDAKKAADAIANSILLKCAWAGGDPNWGRIVDALGYSGCVFSPDLVDVFYGDNHLVHKGGPGPADPKKVRHVAAQKEFSIRINLHAGTASRTVLSTDLTEEYVRLNLSE